MNMCHSGPKVLVPSIIDPAIFRGGAGAATRGLISVLQQEPLAAQVEYIFPVKPLIKADRLRQINSISRSLYSRLPSKAMYYYSKPFARNVERRVRNANFDLVILNGGDLLWLLEILPAGLPTILFAHNLEYRLFESQLRQHRHLPKLVIDMLNRDLNKLRAFELEGMSRVSGVLFLSSSEAQEVQCILSGLEVLHVPPLFDYQSTVRPPRPKEANLNIGFMANFGWWPNQAGLRWFLDKVLPRLADRITLHLFGECSREMSDSDPRIVTHGFVSQLTDVWQECDFMICPIFEGAGAKIKIAEALYNGMPVLTTSFATRCFAIPEHPGIILLDQADQWVEFLNSTGAWSLRDQSIPTTVSNIFWARDYIVPVQRFFRKATSPSSSRVG